MIQILCTTRNKNCNASIELQSSRWDSDLRKKEKKIRSKVDYTFLTTKTTMMTTTLIMQFRSSFFIQCLHRSDHRQINLERETKWISSKPKQNGAETKPITYNNKKKLPICLQQQTKLSIAYNKKQNYRLLTLTRNKTTDYLQSQRQPKLVLVTCRAQQDWKKLLNPFCSSNNKTDYLWEQKTTAAWETGKKEKKRK
jgi:hypothetical protein